MQQTLNQSLIICGKPLRIQGTNIHPLFDAKEVIESILEYKQLEDCRFYKDNKDKPLFVTKIQDQYMTGVLPVNSKYHKNADLIYLTEFGLYECLFSSNKPIAQQFRIQIMTLLSDIRIGNLKLLVQRECETTRLLSESKADLMSYITKNSQLQEQLDQLQMRLDQSLEEIHIYEIEIEGKLYRGTTIELIRRLKQHMRKSSNPNIRRACSEGIQLKTRLIHSQRVSNRHERNYIERSFIQQIPLNIRLNKSIPRVANPSQVSEECKLQLNQGLHCAQDLSVIDDQTLNNQRVIRQQCIDKWKAKYDAYFKFTELLKRNPVDSDKDRNEKLIAKWVYKQRNNYDKLENWQQEQLSRIQYFKPEVKAINTEAFEVKLQKVSAIYREKGELTSASLGKLFSWYCDYSKKMKLNEIGEYERVLLTNSGIPLHVSLEEQWMKYYNECLHIYNSTGKLPVDRQIQGQFNLGKWARRQREYKDKLTDEQVKLLDNLGLLDKKCTSSKDYQQQFKSFVDQHKSMPKSQGTQSEVYLYKWMMRNKDNSFVQDVIKSLEC